MTRPAHPMWCDRRLCTAAAAGPSGAHRSVTIRIDPGDQARPAYVLAVHREQAAALGPDDARVVVTVTALLEGTSSTEFSIPLDQAAELRDELGAALNLEGQW